MGQAREGLCVCDTILPLGELFAALLGVGSLIARGPGLLTSLHCVTSPLRLRVRLRPPIWGGLAPPLEKRREGREAGEGRSVQSCLGECDCSSVGKRLLGTLSSDVFFSTHFLRGPS